MSSVVRDLVSTVIPVRNRPRAVREAVHSVLAQTHRPVEILVVDNASTDETPRALEELSRAHPEVTTLSQPVAGPGPARERGRIEARGEFIQYLDSDDLLETDKFERQVALLRQHSECGVAYGRSRVLDPDGTVTDPARDTGVRRERLFPGLLVDRWWCTDTPLYRRSVCDRVGPWTSLRYSQDWEYDARVGSLDVALAYDDTLVSTHRNHEGPRQTGSRWLGTQDRATFFGTLYDCAVEAGTSPGVPEMRHFARWVFYHARQCALEGDMTAAARCLELNRLADPAERTDVRVYRALCRVIGARLAARLCQGIDAMRPGHAGRDSQPQSWMTRPTGEDDGGAP